MECPRLLSHARPCRTMVVTIALAMLPVPHARPAAGPSSEPSPALQQFLAGQKTAAQYSASRRLEAWGSGRGAWLDAQTDFTRESGLRYRVTAEGGSGYIRSRVLRSLLDEEQRLIARGGAPSVAISTDNYQFTPEGLDEHGLAVVRLEPRRRERSLIAGRMFLTAGGDLVRVEGRLARNPSFWVSRVTLVRSYRRINGVVMPISLETTAQLRLLGSSALRMTYRYSAIDERAVIGSGPREANGAEGGPHPGPGPL